MTPKEKAAELINRYYSITGPFTEAKQCALIAVDELLYYSNSHGFVGLTEYLQEVKQEIEKL
jgi:hypothetical protein